MWSQQPDPADQHRALVALRSVLPKPEGAETRSQSIESPATPEQVAQLLHGEPGFVWLDGAQTGHLLFQNPLATVSCDGKQAILRGPGGFHTFPARSLDALHAALAAWKHPGAYSAGFISYDVAAELEDIGSTPPLDFPRLQFGLYDSVYRLNSEGWSCHCTEAWRLGHLDHAQDLLRRASSASLPSLEKNPARAARPGTDPQFEASVERIVRRIHAGDFFQTNLCRHLQFPLASDLAWPLYRRMRLLNPAEYGAFLQLGGERSILSMSPELFLRVNNGLVETKPIKGTRRRGKTEDEDRALQTDLLHSEKDRAELAMVVDVARNDLSRVCTTGSVKVAEHASLMTLPGLHHTFSRITGNLRPDAGLADLLRASFPPASITGAPKIAAISAALEEERLARGPCMGAVGWVSFSGEMELSVAIRTAYTSRGQVTYLAGCGITSDSNPQSEFEESENKAAAFRGALSSLP